MGVSALEEALDSAVLEVPVSVDSNSEEPAVASVARLLSVAPVVDSAEETPVSVATVDSVDNNSEDPAVDSVATDQDTVATTADTDHQATEDTDNLREAATVATTTDTAAADTPAQEAATADTTAIATASATSAPLVATVAAASAVASSAASAASAAKVLVDLTLSGE